MSQRGNLPLLQRKVGRLPAYEVLILLLFSVQVFISTVYFVILRITDQRNLRAHLLLKQQTGSKITAEDIKDTVSRL